MKTKILQGWYRQSLAPKKHKWHLIIAQPTNWGKPLHKFLCSLSYVDKTWIDRNDFKNNPGSDEKCKKCEKALGSPIVTEGVWNETQSSIGS